jgi:hypothetical protein
MICSNTDCPFLFLIPLLNFKLNNMLDNNVPVEVWKYSTKEKLGEYPSIKKALNAFGIFTGLTSSISFIVSKKKNGQPRTIKCKKLNDRIYLKLLK